MRFPPLTRDFVEDRRDVSPDCQGHTVESKRPELSPEQHRAIAASIMRCEEAGRLEGEVFRRARAEGFQGRQILTPWAHVIDQGNFILAAPIEELGRHGACSAGGAKLVAGSVRRLNKVEYSQQKPLIIDAMLTCRANEQILRELFAHTGDSPSIFIAFGSNALKEHLIGNGTVPSWAACTSIEDAVQKIKVS